MRLKLPTELYTTQLERWPKQGRHIMSHHDDDTLVVYQAYHPEIADYAIEHGSFGGPAFRLGRMSWIKPNFLWMMHRCGWGRKANQERVLGLRLRRSFFDEILMRAVASSHTASHLENHAEWKEALRSSDVCLQWDPDHDPNGQNMKRRAIQLGMRGEVLRRFAQEEILEVIDITPFMREQDRVRTQQGLDSLHIPQEYIYRPHDAEIFARLRLDS